jgi:hypothetical protein
MKENVFENPVEARSTMSAPHFNDQRVVQRAQPVVPLDEIRTKLRLRRIWYLGGAFALAIILGAISALVAVRIKSTTTAQQAEIAQPAIEPASEIATPQTELQTGPQMEQASLVEEETPAESPEPELKPTPTTEIPARQRPRVVTRDLEPLEPRRRGEPSEEERWQERRARRAARREQRRNRRGDDRDLTHVDELFEGPRRPERPRY